VAFLPALFQKAQVIQQLSSRAEDTTHDKRRKPGGRVIKRIRPKNSEEAPATKKPSIPLHRISAAERRPEQSTEFEKAVNNLRDSTRVSEGSLFLALSSLLNV